jgi:hypothetical protein
MHQVTKEDAKAIYTKLKGLAGAWEGTERDGRKERLTYEVVADGSVVMEHSSFVDHPEDSMVTMYHLDGDRLLLTHYCEAHNQPRLQATSISDDGKNFTFTFLDGTNMASRETGHMDQVEISMPDSNHCSSRWSWYQKGKEQWFEKFTYHRVMGKG